MDIVILKSEKTDTTFSASMSAGKMTAHLFFCAGPIRQSIGVCVDNAAHQTWRGMGKTFLSWDEAAASYKSGAMKAMIAEFKRIATGEQQ